MDRRRRGYKTETDSLAFIFNFRGSTELMPALRFRWSMAGSPLPRGSAALPLGPEARRRFRGQRHSGRTDHDRTGCAATA